MDDKKLGHIQHTFTQQYTNWDKGTVFDQFTCRTNTFEIIEMMDLLEAAVYRDRDYTLANKMIYNGRL
jgi:hypothetical protein